MAAKRWVVLDGATGEPIETKLNKGRRRYVLVAKGVEPRQPRPGEPRYVLTSKSDAQKALECDLAKQVAAQPVAVRFGQIGARDVPDGPGAVIFERADGRQRVFRGESADVSEIEPVAKRRRGLFRDLVDAPTSYPDGTSRAR